MKKFLSFVAILMLATLAFASGPVPVGPTPIQLEEDIEYTIVATGCNSPVQTYLVLYNAGDVISVEIEGWTDPIVLDHGESQIIPLCCPETEGGCGPGIESQCKYKFWLKVWPWSGPPDCLEVYAMALYQVQGMVAQSQEAKVGPIRVLPR